MEFFSCFSNMKWSHIAGHANVADPLSRNPSFTAALTVESLDPSDPIHSREIFPDILLAKTGRSSSNAQFAINNSYNSSIRDFPFRLLYGRYPRVALQPPDTILPDASPTAVSWVQHMTTALDCAKKALRPAQDRQRTYANLHRRPVTFLIGQEVMLSTKNLKYWPGRARKLLPRFVGPFPITRVYDNHGAVLNAPPCVSYGTFLDDVFYRLMQIPSLVCVADAVAN
eukprot:gene28217-biopygen32176